MILDPKTVSASEMYRFMISVIVPRPIAFVSTIGEAGRPNAAPFSFFIGLSSDPPLLGIAINHRGEEPKDTLRNLRETGDFVVNAVNEDLAEKIVETSGDWPAEVDELALTGLTSIPSELVKAPRVAESPVQLECALYGELELGKTILVIGEILRAHVSDDVLTDGRVDVTKLRPLARLGGDGYSVIREVLHLRRPQVERNPVRP